ncbi:MAG: ROK family protein [Ilumatobacteraceae bacterium]
MDSPVEHLHVRRHNLSLVLRLLASHGPRSRAGVAELTGLTRATASSLIAELIDRGLVKEVGLKSEQRVGRPATLVQLDGSHVATLGVEVDLGFISVLANDLSGTTLYRKRRTLSGGSTSFEDILPSLVREMRRAITAVESMDARVAGASIAIPGIVDMDRGVVRRAPNLGWKDAPLGRRLRAEFGDSLPIVLDNEANLSALAEYHAGTSAGAQHLVYVLAVNGVGGGVVVGGELFRGASGAAGEVGHMTVQPRGSACACGSTGCWETTVGLRALLAEAVPDIAEELLQDTRLSPEAKVKIVCTRAEAEDPLALKGLRTFGRWLGVGLANIVDVFNPDVVILGGFLPAVAPWTMDEAQRAFRANAMSESAGACRIELSSLGWAAGAMGGTMLAAERLFLDPTLVPSTA